MSETDEGLATVLKQMGVKFMLMKRRGIRRDDYDIAMQDDTIAKFSPDKVVGVNLDYDEAVALIRILEGDNYGK